MKGNIAKTPSWNPSKTVFEFLLAVDRAVKCKNLDNTYSSKTGYLMVRFLKQRAIDVANMNLGVGDLIEITGDDQILEFVISENPETYKYDREILGRTIKLLNKKGFKKETSNASRNVNPTQTTMDSIDDITESWTAD